MELAYLGTINLVNAATTKIEQIEHQGLRAEINISAHPLI